MTLWIGYWWCNHCAVAVDSEHATIAATHSLASGGCGKRLTERFNSTEPPEDDELTRLTAENERLRAEIDRLVDGLIGERDALAAENARLREAVKPILYAIDDDGEMQDFRGGARDRLGKAIRAARALVEAPR